MKLLNIGLVHATLVASSVLMMGCDRGPAAQHQEMSKEAPAMAPHGGPDAAAQSSPGGAPAATSPSQNPAVPEMTPPPAGTPNGTPAASATPDPRVNKVPGH